MSYGGYQQYGGNPYGQSGQAEEGYGASNPYGGTGGGYGASNPYGGTGGGYGASEQHGGTHALNPPPLTHENSAVSGGSEYSQAAPYPSHQGATPLSQQDFLARIDGTKSRINQLSNNITQIANIHQRMLSSPDNNSTAQLEGIVSETQIRNTQIKDEIKFLERDAAREPNNSFKRTQVASLKRTFTKQLEDFQREESDYSKRYRDAIARQYRIVNPDATEQEVQEAANADWGDEGIFQQALKSNRSGQAQSVLGAVRARHNDIQRIEKTMVELAQLFEQLNEVVVYQEAQVEQVEQQTHQVNDDAKHANQQLDSGIKSARNARKLKWWCLFIVVLIIAIIALVLGIYFGVVKKNQNNNNNNNNA
ncbi:t-SNARE [Lentithecium fluviatile CBS 122367]|uniref:t-SNARE n=1 Tax=Lentithecium fluviatile CBS 122367 TaxID=1168545 RepID=A0A6G1JF01_9PLEO|nr:t-SNARE [Lentithecium fluviatile CBS 122367]